jgi:hypothetical protein
MMNGSLIKEVTSDVGCHEDYFTVLSKTSEVMQASGGMQGQRVSGEDRHTDADVEEGFEKHLLLAGERFKYLLNHFERAARLANNATARCHRDGQDAAVEAFFEDYFDLLDPIGTEKRTQCNRRVEEEFLGIETSYMGHLLMNDVAQFRSLVQAGAENVVNELLEIADSMNVEVTSTLLSRSAYEDLYAAGDQEAFTWQDLMDDHVLLRLRRLLRKHVIAFHYLIHL